MILIDLEFVREFVGLCVSGSSKSSIIYHHVRSKASALQFAQITRIMCAFACESQVAIGGFAPIESEKEKKNHEKFHYFKFQRCACFDLLILPVFYSSSGIQSNVISVEIVVVVTNASIAL